ncbi:MAG TPA: hypothetical protein VJO33_04535, partial [Gemmatimonadaceae bacterium]|nr:hypothetical protein [Gemmatimonadaceae bacterium]
MPNPTISIENLLLELRLAAGRGAAALIVGIVLAACSSSGSNTTQPPPATPSIDISLSPTAVSVSQGQSGTATATVNRTNFTGSVTLTAEGLPTGVSASFNPPSLANGVASSVLTLTAAASAPPTNLVPLSARVVRAKASSAAASTNSSSSSASVTIRATGSGVSDKTVALSLSVVVAGGYTLSASPASLSMQQGGNGSSTINIARSGGFAGTVALSVTGAPTGVTATFNPTSTSGNSSSLSVAAAASTAPGNYALTVTGTSAGLGNQSTTVNVTVTALTSSSVQYCSSDTPIWFGYQNDGASWVRVAVGANNTFTFSATPKVAIAAVTQSGSGQTASYDLTVVYTTPAEIGALAGAICAQQGGSKQLNGSVAGLAVTEAAQIAMGSSSAFALSTPGTFTLSNLPDGALDLVAGRFPFGDPNTLAP